MADLVAKRYAKALMEIGGEKKTESYIAALDAVVVALSDAKSDEAINSPLISASDKTAWIIEALGSKSDPALINLIKIMGEKGRLNLIPELAEILKFERKKASNAFVGTVESKEKLDAKLLKKLEATLSKHSGAKITLEQASSDLNGIKVAVEDLGLELNFSKDRVKRSLIDYIQKAL